MCAQLMLRRDGRDSPAQAIAQVGEAACSVLPKVGKRALATAIDVFGDRV